MWGAGARGMTTVKAGQVEGSELAELVPLSFTHSRRALSIVSSPHSVFKYFFPSPFIPQTFPYLSQIPSLPQLPHVVCMSMSYFSFLFHPCSFVVCIFSLIPLISLIRPTGQQLYFIFVCFPGKQ